MRTAYAVAVVIAATASGSPAFSQAVPQPSTSTASVAEPWRSGKPEDVGLSSQRLQEVSKTLHADVERGRIPGAVLLVARRGRLVYQDAIGYRDKAGGVPMTLDTIFNIASMTKPITAVATLQLYERGKLLMDDPLAKYFPKFAEQKVAILSPGGDAITSTVPAAREITIQDLLRHTSGIVYGGRGNTVVHKMYPSGSVALASMSSAEAIEKLATPPLLHQPGAVWDYGFGLDLAGLVVESLSEQTLGQYFEEHIFKPLGMTDTSFRIPAAKVDRYAKALPTDPDSGQPQSLPDLSKPMKLECGGGCLASTASDYMRFAMMLMAKGKVGQNRVLGRKTVEYMLSDQLGSNIRNLIGNADPTRADYGFGLGLAVRTTPGIVRMMGSVGEFSWPGASGTNWWADPKEELIVVFMSHAPGPIRWHYRQLINAMIEQAIID